jgi:hypothetical protein
VRRRRQREGEEEIYEVTLAVIDRRQAGGG